MDTHINTWQPPIQQHLVPVVVSMAKLAPHMLLQEEVRRDQERAAQRAQQLQQQQEQQAATTAAGATAAQDGSQPATPLSAAAATAGGGVSGGEGTDSPTSAQAAGAAAREGRTGSPGQPPSSQNRSQPSPARGGGGADRSRGNTPPEAVQVVPLSQVIVCHFNPCVECMHVALDLATSQSYESANCTWNNLRKHRHCLLRGTSAIVVNVMPGGCTHAGTRPAAARKPALLLPPADLLSSGHPRSATHKRHHTRRADQGTGSSSSGWCRREVTRYSSSS
jgi:hypothetical protein